MLTPLPRKQRKDSNKRASAEPGGVQAAALGFPSKGVAG